MTLVSLPRERLLKAKRSFVTRRVPLEAMVHLLTGYYCPVAGDLVLATVELLGQHLRIEQPDGRKAALYPGDEIIVSFGSRYAPDQFESRVGADLSPCDLVAAGGIASVELARHERMRPPTRIKPIGLIAGAQGQRLNLSSFGLSASDAQPKIPVVLSLGTSMNAGKTTTATSLVRGLRSAGLRVAAIKITGTGSGGDLWTVTDAGADLVLDFTDAGFASTYLVPIKSIEKGAFRLLNYACARGCDVAVVEIADGLQQKETAALLRSPAIRQLCLGAVFASYDAMGAALGVSDLRRLGYNVLGVSGRLARSPLATREAEEATGLKVCTPLELQHGVLNARMAAATTVQELSSLSGELLEIIRSKLETHAICEHETDPEAPRIALLSSLASEAIELDVQRLCGASHGSRSSQRMNHRAGWRSVKWSTNVGVIELRVPRLRRGHYSPSFMNVHIIPTAAIDEALHLAGSYQGLEALRNLVANLRMNLNDEILSRTNGGIADLRAAERTAHQEQVAVKDPVLLHSANGESEEFMFSGGSAGQDDYFLVPRRSVPHLHPTRHRADDAVGRRSLAVNGHE
jgi:hypothetical protein